MDSIQTKTQLPSAVALAFGEMRTPYASGRELCEQKFGNVYQRKEIEKQMTHFKSILPPGSSNDSAKYSVVRKLCTLVSSLIVCPLCTFLRMRCTHRFHDLRTTGF